MSLTHEHLAIHAAISFGTDPEAVLDAIDSGAWRPDRFTDPELRHVAEVVLELVMAGAVPWADVVHAELVARGIDHADAADLVEQPGAFEAAGCRVDGLGHWLAEVERDHVRRRLVAAGHALESRGGLERAREQLREVAA